MLPKYATYITAPPEEVSTAYIFTVAQRFSIGQVTFIEYSKGLFISTGGDAVMISADLDANLSVAFRNNGTWAIAKTI